MCNLCLLYCQFPSPPPFLALLDLVIPGMPHFGCPVECWTGYFALITVCANACKTDVQCTVVSTAPQSLRCWRACSMASQMRNSWWGFFSPEVFYLLLVMFKWCHAKFSCLFFFKVTYWEKKSYFISLSPPYFLLLVYLSRHINLKGPHGVFIIGERVRAIH